MKKSIFQLIIIAIFIAGMIGIIVVVKTNIKGKNYDEYKPTSNFFDDEEIILLDDYKLVEFVEHDFPLFSKLRSAQTYFDEEVSFKDFDIDEATVKVGEKVVEGSVLGKLNGTDVTCDCIGLVVAINDVVSIKIITDIYIKFSYNIYSYENYQIGDVFDILKEGIKVTTGTIIDINYYEIFEDCVDVTVLIDNSEVLFANATQVEFTPTGYETRKAYAIDPALLYIYNEAYQVIGKNATFLCIKDKMLYEINVELGILYYGFLEIKSATYDLGDFDISGGKLYVKATA
ncbi:MAG: hypothetical protein LBE09_04645 [Christensenellaceae bacterium]|jgi:hypothetical protein|nr:hypothetical protein [Christensenellaceae bacterium]